MKKKESRFTGLTGLILKSQLISKLIDLRLLDGLTDREQSLLNDWELRYED